MALAALIINQRKDPTTTLTLRSQMIQDIDVRMTKLRVAIRKKLIDEKFLGGTTKKEESYPNVLPFAMAAYVYERSDLKVEQFMDWLRNEEAKGILEVTKHPILPRGQQAWSDVYVRSSYQSGLAKARTKLRQQGVDIPSFKHVPGGVAGVMNQPFHADRVGLIYTRTFNEMKGITEAMNQQLSRALARGMAEGKGPRQIATDMVGTKKRPGIVNRIGRNRARLIARTEIVQSHNEGALNEFEAAENVIGEEVLCQWWSALDERVRPKHDAHTGWHGLVMTRSEGRARLGAPNCRCALFPWVPSHHDVVPTKITSAARAVIGDRFKPKAIDPKLKSKESRKHLQGKYDEAKEKYDASSFPARIKLYEKMTTARIALTKTFSKAEIMIEKRAILTHMTKLDPGVKLTKAMNKKLTIASNWLPVDVLYNLETKGTFTIRNISKRKLRAHYDEAWECILAKDDTGITFAHELSHLVDGSFYEQGFSPGKTGFRWTDGKFVTKEDGDKLSRLFKNHHSGRKGKYTNGDGFFWEDNWINNYEGRIYGGGGTGQEWWAVNCERYADYRYRLSVSYDITVEKQIADITRFKKELNKWEETVKDIESKVAGDFGEERILKRKLESAQLQAKDRRRWVGEYEQKLDKLTKERAEKWAERLSKWKLARKKYPDLADFIEEKFGKDFVN
jgi:hypothetical protein